MPSIKFRNSTKNSKAIPTSEWAQVFIYHLEKMKAKAVTAMNIVLH
jgi:hypothetical protein